LKDVRDWGISRNRFFGTPIPTWVSDDGEEVVFVGSIDELVELAGLTERPKDLHRDTVDGILIPSKKGKGMLKRVTDVFDCWFESGSAPFAQYHYPFENQEIFDDKEYLGDFVAEGVDQSTRWFYVSAVLATALFRKPAYKNIICIGMLLADDGKKMSKRLKNYPDPLEVIREYGADALRLYLADSPAMHADPVRFIKKNHERYVGRDGERVDPDDEVVETQEFQEKLAAGEYKLVQIAGNNVHDVLRTLVPWYNSLVFLEDHIDKFTQDTNIDLDPDAWKKTDNIMDRWIVSRLGSLVKAVDCEMMSFRIYNVLRHLTGFIDELTNTYLKFNRVRCKGKNGAEDQMIALSTLCYVSNRFATVMAPFTPELGEYIHGRLKKYQSEPATSVFLEDYPVYDEFPIDLGIEELISRLRMIIDQTRLVRAQNRSHHSVKKPIKKITIYNSEESWFDGFDLVQEYLCTETGILEVDKIVKKDQLVFKLILDHKVTGKKYGKEKKVIASLLDSVPQVEIKAMYEKKTPITLNGGEKSFILIAEDVNVIAESSIKPGKNEVLMTEMGTSVVFDLTVTDDLEEQYILNLVYSAVQMARKELKLKPVDIVDVIYETESESIKQLIQKHLRDLESRTGSNFHGTEKLNNELLVGASAKELGDDKEKFVVYLQRVSPT